jgi:predicted nucleic acid-binding protein
MIPERIFADTNLFLRYLTDDVPQQADAFERLLRSAANGELTFITNSLVIAEIVWTLESYYRLPKKDIQKKILAILNTAGLEIDNSDQILQAMLWYEEKNIGFIDAYNAAWMLNNNIQTICTFDRKHFERLEEVKTIVPGR